MSVEPSRWQLYQGDVLLGTLVSYEWDFPWINCKFSPTPAFASHRAAFDEDVHLLDTVESDDDWDTYDAHYARMIDGMRLVAIGDSEHIKEFLLHIDEDEAWFRAVFED